jgi:DNA-binding NtrC family response regulator
VRTDLRDKAVVGSGKGCELTLAGETVSAHHLEISREEGVLRLRDLTSTNGTWLGLVRVKDIELPLGARVRVGQWDVWVAKREDARAAARPVATPGGLVTNDPVMIGLLDRINTIANSSWPVLIQGETGTGKELFARAIHERSSRSAQKYTKYNFGVGRSPENMATELFGHEKRAFTGADGAKIGILRTVDGGTILLDEIGELPLEIQPTMLRAVGEGEIQPLGAAEPVKVDVRYIAATKRDLPQAIREGRFRDDLFYRLSVIPFIIPPLRQRKGDIVLLWDHITRELSGHPSRPLSPAAREKLLNHPWPGNVRELENAVKRVILLGQRGPTVEASDIEFDPSFAAAAAPAPAAATLPPGVAGFIDTNDRTFEQIKSDALAAVMRKVGGNRTTAAKLLDVERKTLIRMLETYGLEKVGVEE